MIHKIKALYDNGNGLGNRNGTSVILWAKANLIPIDGSAHTDIYCALPFTRRDYFELADSTGRDIREDKAGLFPKIYSPY